jgi:hypothetical protein
MNSGFAFNQAPTTNEHFIVGDFIVVDTSNEKQEVQDDQFKIKSPMTLDNLLNPHCYSNKSSTTTSSSSVLKKKGLRFDERFLLKEDYDFTAQHLEV